MCCVRNYRMNQKIFPMVYGKKIKLPYDIPYNSETPSRFEKEKQKKNPPGKFKKKTQKFKREALKGVWWIYMPIFVQFRERVFKFPAVQNTISFFWPKVARASIIFLWPKKFN